VVIALLPPRTTRTELVRIEPFTRILPYLYCTLLALTSSASRVTPLPHVSPAAQPTLLVLLSSHLLLMAANHPRCTDMSAPNYWPHPLVPLHQDSFPYGPDSAHQPPQMPTFANPRGASTTTALVGATGAQGPTLVQPPTAPSSGPEVSRTRDDHGRTENVGGGSGHDSRHSFASAPSVDDSPVPVPQKPIRRRMRMITSCLECRRRKLKCEKKQPCYNCKRFQRNCVYLSPNLDEASQQRLTEIKEKVGSLERQLERDVAKGARARRSSSPDGDSSRSRRFVADDVVDEDGEPQITPLVALDLTYDDYSDGNGTDDLIDLGIRVGKMRITERIGGLNRPRLSEEVFPVQHGSCLS
jgi:hypothetical protein